MRRARRRPRPRFAWRGAPRSASAPASVAAGLLLVGVVAACAGGTGSGDATVAGAPAGSAMDGAAGAAECSDLPERPFRAALDPLEDSRRGSRIRFHNTTGCTLRVTSISFFECDNVQNECEREIPLDVVVPPGEERNVFTVLSEDRNHPWSFRYRYNWARVRG